MRRPFITEDDLWPAPPRRVNWWRLAGAAMLAASGGFMIGWIYGLARLLENR